MLIVKDGKIKENKTYLGSRKPKDLYGISKIGQCTFTPLTEGDYP